MPRYHALKGERHHGSARYHDHIGEGFVYWRYGRLPVSLPALIEGYDIVWPDTD
jgi:hypothetical protein